jgi:hypothetical protein
MFDMIYLWLVNHMDIMETAICFMAALTALGTQIMLIRERRRKR